jgi:hypothetical protein
VGSHDFDGSGVGATDGVAVGTHVEGNGVGACDGGKVGTVGSYVGFSVGT